MRGHVFGQAGEVVLRKSIYRVIAV
jgi:hypothetical protein